MELIKEGKFASIYLDSTEGLNRYLVKVEVENRKYIFGRIGEAQKLYKEVEKQYKIKLN